MSAAPAVRCSGVREVCAHSAAGRGARSATELPHRKLSRHCHAAPRYWGSRQLRAERHDRYSRRQSDGAGRPPSRVNLDAPVDIRAVLIFLAVIAGGLFFMAYSIYSDIERARRRSDDDPAVPVVRRGDVIALGFEFVNGFHDTANAVATVIYTHALNPGRRRLVGLLEPARRAHCDRRRRFRHRLAAACRTDPAGRLRAPVTPWCSRCSSPRSSGTSAPGGSACRRRLRTR